MFGQSETSHDSRCYGDRHEIAHPSRIHGSRARPWLPGLPVVTTPIAVPLRVTRILEIGMIAYLTIYAFEGPIRYLLLQLQLDNAIFLRDALLALILVPVFFTPGIGPIARTYLAWFVAILGIHSIIIYGNFQDLTVIAYVFKEFMPVLFGVILGRLSGAPSRFVVSAFAALWCVTALGLVLDKFVLTFPWTGLSTMIGGIKVDVGRDWMVHGFDKRVGGFTRSSIHAALFLPLMSMLPLVTVRRWSLRFLITALTCGCVALTTQKGALIGYLLVSVCFLVSYTAIRGALKAAYVAGLLLTFSLPLLLSGVTLQGSGGVYSLSSFAMRTGLTWPKAFHWISQNEIFPFGVGLGGIGGAQRLYSPGDFNPGDNMFLFLYASFGVMTFVYVGFLSYICLADGRRNSPFDRFPRAVAAFHFTYGAVMSIVEDQSSCIILGLSIGYLLFARSPEPTEAVVAVPRRGGRTVTRRAEEVLADPPLSAA